jgi:predicted 3-demethylubiquinone-9 3-methyltransferase (glyoxalase superfamily)
MNKTIYPCLWFDNNAREAAGYYKDVFEDVNILSENQLVLMFEIYGVKFMGLKGGEMFRPNPAVSYFVYCGGDDAKIERLYASLSKGGRVMMPLEKYDWSAKYAWVEDRFGISWQLDIDAINNPQKIVPALLFANDKRAMVGEALSYYTSIFDDSRHIISFPIPSGSSMPDGALMFTQFRLKDLIFNALSGGEPVHEFDFCEGNSFVIECETQKEIDHYWSRFAEEGMESMCGWVRDKYGVWWQVIPSMLESLIVNSGKGQQVGQALRQMKKIELDVLINAAQ